MKKIMLINKNSKQKKIKVKNQKEIIVMKDKNRKMNNQKSKKILKNPLKKMILK